MIEIRGLQLMSGMISRVGGKRGLVGESISNHKPLILRHCTIHHTIHGTAKLCCKSLIDICRRRRRCVHVQFAVR